MAVCLWVRWDSGGVGASPQLIGRMLMILRTLRTASSELSEPKYLYAQTQSQGLAIVGPDAREVLQTIRLNANPKCIVSQNN